MATQMLELAAEAKVTGNAKVLLVELARRADESGVTDIVSYAALSEAVGVGVSTVHHSMNRLLDRGLVDRVERVVRVGSRYRVLTRADVPVEREHERVLADRMVHDDEE